MLAGTIGQIKGPFRGGQNAFAALYAEEGSSSERMKIGVSIDQKDLLPFGNEQIYTSGLSFTIVTPVGQSLIQMGRTGMYETDNAVQVNSLIFSNDTPQSVIINYTIY